MSWTFAAVLGQEETVARLQREAAQGRSSHSYLLEGQAGSGRLSLARAFSAFLLCQNREAGDACGVCRSCRLLAHGDNPDYLELPRQPAELRIGRFIERQGVTETVEHQPLLAFLRFKPVEAALRIAVIPDAERMRPEAANAFLKTLEEPPGDSVIILTVNSRDRLPTTIVSRCRRIGMLPLPPAVVAEELRKRGLVSGNDAEDVALAAEGALGAALRLADSEILGLWRWLDREAFAEPGLEAAEQLNKHWQAAVLAGSDNQAKRRNALAALDLAALALRRRLRRDLGPDQAEAGLRVLWDAGEKIFRNVKPDLVLLTASLDIMAALRAS